jgi:hypothetical protein
MTGLRNEFQEPGRQISRSIAEFGWGQPVMLGLGFWLMTSPVSYGYGSAPLVIHDLAAGAILVCLATLGLAGKRAWISYTETILGIWLLFAPLAFWAPASVVYANHTLMGILIILFSILIPSTQPLPGPQIPPGWTYNPSSWPQRTPIIALGLIGFFVSRHMAGYQLDYIDSAWDPLFGDGTEKVLESEVSQWFPISDAGLGAMIYLIDSLSAVGDEKRWRTSPWMVAVLGVAAIPAGLVSMVLVMLQPTVVGAWCTLCLVQATVTLAIIALALDEVWAMLQFLNKSRKAGRSLWKTFWLGGDIPEAQENPRPDRKPTWSLSAMTWGTSSAWNLWLSAIIGVWVTFSPDLWNLSGTGPNTVHIAGILAVTFSIIALAEIARPIRFLNWLPGIWLALGAWFFGVENWAWQISNLVAGLALLSLSFPHGTLRDRYGDELAHIHRP